MRVKSNKVFDILDFANQELAPVYEPQEIKSLMAEVFSHFMGWDRVQLSLNHKSTINESDLLKVYFAIKDLKNHRPLQYITGKTEFYGLDLLVDENVLIPRPETEELIALIMKDKGQNPIRILDMGTGSGAIAIALAKNFPEAKVSACDVSKEALVLAKQNAAKNQVNIDFFEMDMMLSSEKELNGEFDLIVSNPPYVCLSEKVMMRKNVLDYEPHLALFVEDQDPLCFYRAILKTAQTALEENGFVFFEINERFGQAMLNLSESMEFSAELYQDVNGKDRFIKVWRKD